MCTTTPSISVRVHRSNWLCCLLPLVTFFGCNAEFLNNLNLSGGQEPPSAGVTVNADWHGRPYSAGNKPIPAYGNCVNLLVDGILLVCGEKPRPSNFVVCYERQLTAAQADLLVGTAADIFLPNLQTLTPEAAQVLGKSRGILSLPALEKICSTAAAKLGGQRTSLVLTGLTELTDEAATGLARVIAPLKLDGLKSLAPGVAEALAGHTDHLSLNGITRLSVSDGVALARHQGDLCLNGIESLSAEVAVAVAGLRHGLHLNGLPAISAPAAAALARHRGWQLSLNGLRADRVAPEVIALLSQRPRTSHGIARLPVGL